MVKSSRAFPSWAARTQLCSQAFLLAEGLEPGKLLTEIIAAGVQTRMLKTHMCSVQNCDILGNSKKTSPPVTIFHFKSKILNY